MLICHKRPKRELAMPDALSISEVREKTMLWNEAGVRQPRDGEQVDQIVGINDALCLPVPAIGT